MSLNDGRLLSTYSRSRLRFRPALASSNLLQSSTIKPTSMMSTSLNRKEMTATFPPVALALLLNPLFDFFFSFFRDDNEPEWARWASLPSPALFISLHLVTDRSAPGVLTILDSYVDVYIYTVVHRRTPSLQSTAIYDALSLSLCVYRYI